MGSDPVATEGRLRRVNLVAAVAFAIGGSLFALGAGVAQLGSGDAATSASIYLAGGVLFSTGGYACVLLAINSRSSPAAGSPWRWLSYEPLRIEWLSAFVLFAGTLVFGVNLVDSFIEGLSAEQVNRLIWTPDVVGCVLFLISGHLALTALSPRGRRWRPRPGLDWWIAAVNQVGSILFMASALADYTRPATESVVNVDVANWGTLTGALCFAIGGVMQAFAPAAAGAPPNG